MGKEIWEGTLQHRAVALSYCWLTPGHPDPAGVQAALLKRYLQDHIEIDIVFVDFSVLPQKERTKKETSVFRDGLKNVTIVYLACRVVSLVSPTYIERFWPQFEAFLSF